MQAPACDAVCICGHPSKQLAQQVTSICPATLSCLPAPLLPDCATVSSNQYCVSCGTSNSYRITCLASGTACIPSVREAGAACMLHAAALQLGRSCRLWLAAGCAGCAGAPQSVQAQGRGAWLLAGLLQTALLPTAALCLPHLGRLPGCTSPAKSAAGLAHAYPLPFPTQHSLHTPTCPPAGWLRPHRPVHRQQVWAPGGAAVGWLPRDGDLQWRAVRVQDQAEHGAHGQWRVAVRRPAQ